MDTLTKTPLEIYLYQTEFDALQKLAAEQGVAVEELARQAIAALLPPEEPAIEEELNSPLEAFIGLGRSGVSDLSINHDRYLMEFELESNRQWPEKSS
jgi:hypothetical protein